MEYLLEKKIWTDADFAQMGWHDCRIYKLRLTRDLELDIDYIFRWNQPEIEGHTNIRTILISQRPEPLITTLSMNTYSFVCNVANNNCDSYK